MTMMQVGMAAVVVMIIALRDIVELAEASGNMHYVGGSKTSWAPNVNLSEWATHETFYVGEWLYFGYEKYRYNVLEVNETSYEKCIDTDFIKNVTGGAGRDVFNLLEDKTYYFLSGGGYCFQGMKVAINVLQQTPPTAAPTAPTSAAAATAASSSSYYMIFPSLLVLVLLVLIKY